MTHPLVLGLFPNRSSASAAATEVHALGVDRGHLSVVARTHDEEQTLSTSLDATPGAEIEDSRLGGLLGEIGGQLLAYLSVVTPGVGPLVAAGPLGADLGEAVGHLAGGLCPTLEKAGVSEAEAERWEDRVRDGAVLLGVHVKTGEARSIEETLRRCGAEAVALAEWPGA